MSRRVPGITCYYLYIILYHYVRAVLPISDFNKKKKKKMFLLLSMRIILYYTICTHIKCGTISNEYIEKKNDTRPTRLD